MQIPTLNAKDFSLRPMREGDVSELVLAAQDVAFHRNTDTICVPTTEVLATKWIRKNIDELKKIRPTFITFIIEVSGIVAGAISSIDRGSGKLEIGYWLAQKFCGKGVMNRAVHTATKFYIGKLKYKYIYAVRTRSNEISMRVLEEEGYKIEKLDGKDLLVKRK